MKTRNLKMSVITPSFNSGKYLEETIRCVIDQTYKNIEFIVIDGGSTDNSIDIIKKYEKYFTYWVSEPDKGQTDAINKGFKKATGDMVTWLCADDLLFPDSIENVVNYINKNELDPDKIGVIFGQSENFDDTGYSFISHGNEINLNRLLHIDPNVLQAGSFHSRILIDKIGYLDISLDYCMDYDLWIRILQEGELHYIDELLSRFRLHDESKTVSRKAAFAWDILKRRYKYNKNILSPINYHLLRRIIAANVKGVLNTK